MNMLKLKDITPLWYCKLFHKKHHEICIGSAFQEGYEVWDLVCPKCDKFLDGGTRECSKKA